MPRRSGRTLYKKRTWAKVKSLINVTAGHALDFEEKQNGVFRVFVEKGRTQFFVNLFPPGFGHVVGISETNDADYQDFVDNYQDPIEDAPPAEVPHALDPTTGTTTPVWAEPIAGDGKHRVLASHKPVLDGKESFNYFTSRGDDIASTAVGEGNWLNLAVTSGTESAHVDLRFLSEHPDIQEVIYIYGGSISWENAGWGDHLCFQLRTNPTPVVPRAVAEGYGLPVDYSLDGERIYYAGPDAGDYALGGNPAWVPTFSGTGYWNLQAHPLAAIPAPSGNGAYDWCVTDQYIGSYLHNLSVYGTNHQLSLIDASEAAPLPYGTYMRIEIHNVSDTDWKLWGFLRMYRERLK